MSESLKQKAKTLSELLVENELEWKEWLRMGITGTKARQLSHKYQEKWVRLEDAEADFAVSFGREDREVRVCRWCEEDLTLFGVRLNQIVRLEPSKPRRHFPLSLLVLGPVYTLLEARA